MEKIPHEIKNSGPKPVRIYYKQSTYCMVQTQLILVFFDLLTVITKAPWIACFHTNFRPSRFVYLLWITENSSLSVKQNFVTFLDLQNFGRLCGSMDFSVLIIWIWRFQWFNWIKRGLNGLSYNTMFNPPSGGMVIYSIDVLGSIW